MKVTGETQRGGPWETEVPATGWVILPVKGKPDEREVVQMSGRKAFELSRDPEVDNYGAQVFWTREAAETMLEAQTNPVEHHFKRYLGREISEDELRGTIGDALAEDRITAHRLDKGH